MHQCSNIESMQLDSCIGWGDIHRIAKVGALERETKQDAQVEQAQMNNEQTSLSSGSGAIDIALNHLTSITIYESTDQDWMH